MIDPAGLDWEDVRAFLAIARRGNLPDAAGTLGISAATAGRRLQRLEKTVGHPLFERLPNRLVLTALGREMAAAGSAMQQGAEAFAQRALAAAVPTMAPVRVTATGSMSLFLASHAAWLAERLAGTGGCLEIVTSKAPLDLAGGEADLALRMRRLPKGGALTARRLGRVAFALYAARTMRDAAVSVGGQGAPSMIGLPSTARTPSQSRWVDEAAMAWNAPVVLRIADVGARHRAVQAGAGASLLPCFLGDADPLLVRLAEPPEPLIEDVHLMRRDQPPCPPQAQAVSDALAALFKAQRRALCGEAPRPG